MTRAISVVVLTHNRVHLLKYCVERVLTQTSTATGEIIIWNNASTDATREYLDSVLDPRIRVIHSTRNIGQNAYADAFARTCGSYLVELDDDVIGAPRHWDSMLLEAYRKLPGIGFLAANLVDDPNDTGARMMRERAHLYLSCEINGVRLLKGPVGGACAITSRELYNRVGGFPREERGAFYLEDAAYIEKIGALGYDAAFLEDLKVHHAGGPYYSQDSLAKRSYWEAYRRRAIRRDAAKRCICSLPFVQQLNRRFRWFEAPTGMPLWRRPEWRQGVPLIRLFR